MRRVLLCATLTLALLSGGCFVIRQDGPTAVRGSGNKATQTRKLPAFEGIDFAGAGQLHIAVGGEPSITLEIDDNLIDVITTDVHDGHLVISSSQPYSTSLGLTATITAPSLLSFCQRGSGDTEIVGVQGEDLSIELLGSGNLRAYGTATQVTAEIAGSGDLDLTGLAGRDVTVDIKGSGDARVHATEKLHASIHGSGSIHYRGDPQVEQRVFGSGSVRKE